MSVRSDKWESGSQAVVDGLPGTPTLQVGCVMPVKSPNSVFFVHEGANYWYDQDVLINRYLSLICLLYSCNSGA